MHPYIPKFIQDKFEYKVYKGKFDAVSIFCDISGFTSLTEGLLKYGKKGSGYLTTALQYVFDPMVESIYTHSGFISTFEGDAFIALFEYNEENKEKIISHAMSATSEILNFFKNHGEVKTKENFILKVKIGVGIGKVEWGILNIKSEKNHGFYFRGSAIEKAAKMEHLCERNNFEICEELSDYKENPYIEKNKVDFSENNIKDNIIKKFFPHEFIYWKGGEFRQVVTLFLPVKGKLTYKVLNRLYSLIFQIVNKYNGFLSRLSFGDKGAVFLIFFGFPTSHEDDVRRALYFAETFKKSFNEKDLPIEYRIGISYGLVYAGESGSQKRCELTCHGDIVNYAARLAFIGRHSEIICTEEVEKIGRYFSLFDFGDYKKFKGKKKRLPYYFFRRLKDRIHARGYRLPLIGRDKELEIIEDWLNISIFKGKFGGINYIYGDQGIGKSRLIYALKEKLEVEEIDNNWIEIFSDNMISKPFDGIKIFLKHYFEIGDRVDEDDIEEFLDKIKELKEDKRIDKEIREELWRTYPFIAAEIGIPLEDSLYKELNPKMRLLNFKIAIKEFFKALSQQKPTIIEIVDGQWLDQSTEEFLLQLTRNINDHPIIILVSSRYLENNQKVNYKVSEDCTIRELNLKPLEEGFVKQFAEEILGEGELCVDLSKLLREKAMGIPSYIEQWLMHLNEKKQVKNTNNIWELIDKEIELPSNIDQLIISRIDSLGIQIKEILQHASIQGQRFGLKLLSAMLQNKLKFDNNLYNAQYAGLIVPEKDTRDFYYFTQKLIKDVVYEMQLTTTREKMHRFAMELIEDIYSDRLEPWYDNLSIHAKHGKMKDKYKYYLKKAGDFYKDNYKNKEALEKYLYLEEILTENKEKIDLYINIGSIYRLTGPYSKAESYFNKALLISRDIGEKSKIAHILNLISHVLIRLGKHENIEKNCFEALDIYKELDDKKKICSSYNYLGTIYSVLQQDDKAIKNYEKCLQLSDEIDDEYKKALVYNNLGGIYYKQNNIEKFKQCLLKSHEIEIKYNIKNNLAINIGNIGIIYYKEKKYKEARKHFLKARKINREIGSIHGTCMNVLNIGYTYIGEFKYKQVCKILLENLENCNEVGEKTNKAYTLSCLGTAFNALGNYEKALTYLEESKDLCDKLNIVYIKNNVLKELANTYIELNYLDKALNLIEDQLKEKNPIEDELSFKIILAEIYIKKLISIEKPSLNENFEKLKNIINEINISQLSDKEMKNIKHELKVVKIMKNYIRGKLSFFERNYEKGNKLFLECIINFEKLNEKLLHSKTIESYLFFLKKYKVDLDAKERKNLIDTLYRLNSEMGKV